MGYLNFICLIVMGSLIRWLHSGNLHQDLSRPRATHLTSEPLPKYLAWFATFTTFSTYLIKVINENTKTTSKLTINILERYLSNVFIVNFEQILHIALMFPMLPLNKKIPDGSFKFKNLLSTCFNLLSKK